MQNFVPSINNTNLGGIGVSGSGDSPNAPIENDVIVFHKIPLTALSKKTLQKLSHLLNTKKILRSEEGYERDWRGLATLAKQNEENALTVDDPTKKVIQLWCANNPKTATIAHLEQFLGIIDRWDVSDYIYELLVEDTRKYQAVPQMLSPVNIDANFDKGFVNDFDDFSRGSDLSILTISDVIRAQNGLPPQLYDAFVLYADADLNYASEMLTQLEDNPEYNLKLCIKDRDLLAGVQFEHVALTELIEDRCKHLIVILTHEFLKSPENTFLVNYTQAQQIQHKTRKIVPLLYEESVDIPRTLKIYTHLRYNPATSYLFNFWSKLANSVKNVNMTAEKTISSCYRSDYSNTSTVNPKALLYQKTSYPTICTKVPSVSIIPPDENENPQTQEKSELKSSNIRAHGSKNIFEDDTTPCSTQLMDQLHTSYQTKSTTSMSSLSTASIYSESKKKKKWSNKILRKVFSRSNT